MTDTNHKLLRTQSQLLQCAEEASVLIKDIFNEVSKRLTEETFPDRKEGLTLWQLLENHRKVLKMQVKS